MPQSSPWQYARDFSAQQNQQSMLGQQLMQQILMQEMQGQAAHDRAIADQQARLPQHVLGNLGQLAGTMGNVGAEGLLRQVLGQEQPIADPGLLQQLQGQTIAQGDAGLFKDRASGVGSLAQAGFAPGDLAGLMGMDIVRHTRPGDIPRPTTAREPREPMAQFEFGAEGGRFRVPVPVEEAMQAHESRMTRQADTVGTDAQSPRGGPAARIVQRERNLEQHGFRRQGPMQPTPEGGFSATYINESRNQRLRVTYDADGNPVQ